MLERTKSHLPRQKTSKVSGSRRQFRLTSDYIRLSRLVSPVPNAMSMNLSFQPIPAEFLMRSKLSPLATFVLRGLLFAPIFFQSVASSTAAQEPETPTKHTTDKTSDRLEAIEGVLGKIVQELQSIKQPKAPEAWIPTAHCGFWDHSAPACRPDKGWCHV